MKKSFVVAFLAMSLAGIGILLASVKTDYDHHADFSRYRTYSWIKVHAVDTLWADRIMAAVDGQLTAKGWQKVPSGGDAQVSAFGSTHEQPTLETYYTGLGGGWGWRRGWGGGMGMSTTEVENTPVGTLVVDVFDGGTKKLIFRANASEALSGKPEKNEKKMEKEVEDMFKHFPPPPKG
jgi:hypothetical protein